MNDAANPPIIAAHGIHTYYGASHVLHGVDLVVHPGETVSLIGRNGMGKTTTLRSLVGLTPAREGRVEVHGVDMTRAAHTASPARASPSCPRIAASSPT